MEVMRIAPGFATGWCIHALGLMTLAHLYAQDGLPPDTNSAPATIILPRVEFRETPFTNIVSWLNREVHARLPGHPMPAIVVEVRPYEYKTNGLPAELGPFIDAFVGPFVQAVPQLAEEMHGRLSRPVTISARDISVLETLRVICAAADVSLTAGEGRVVVGLEKRVFRCYAVRLPHWLVAKGEDAVFTYTGAGESRSFERLIKRIIPERSTLLVLDRDDPGTAEQYRRLDENLRRDRPK